MNSIMSYALPCNDQLASPLLSLPAELRNHIFDLCLTSTQPIVNPVAPPEADPNYQPPFTPRSIPRLGAAILATCQRARLEISTAALYANDLHFTTPSHITTFLHSLPPGSISCITTLTLSLLSTPLLPTSTDGTPTSPLVQQWLHFLSCPPAALHHPGSWCAKLPTLRTALPALTRLRIDLTGTLRPRPAEMAHLGIKTGYAAALAQLLRGLAQRSPPPPPERDAPSARRASVGHGRVPGLRVLEVSGHGAHLWDLGDAMRATCWGEWATVQTWVDLVGRVLVPWLAVAVDTLPGEEGWVGLLQRGNGFSLAAMVGEPDQKELGRLGYERATGWEEVVRLTERRERLDHPVFALFV